jgi:hypothetical protein
MPKVYLLSEARSGENPMDGNPVSCLVEPVDWTTEFEEWFASENYALLDNDGCSYRLVWSDENGFSIDLVEQSGELKKRYYNWLRI